MDETHMVECWLGEALAATAAPWGSWECIRKANLTSKTRPGQDPVPGRAFSYRIRRCMSYK